MNSITKDTVVPGITTPTRPERSRDNDKYWAQRRYLSAYRTEDKGSFHPGPQRQI